MLAPVLSYAQKEKEEEKNKDSDGILNLVHAERTVKVPSIKENGEKRKKDDIKYFGAVQFRVGNNDIACDSAIVYVNDDRMEAYNVTVTNPVYFTTKSGMLQYNQATKTATASRDVNITALNGSLVGTAESVEIDLKKENYRIGLGSINPPKQAK